MRGLLLLAPLFLVVAACAAAPDGEQGDPGDEGQGSTSSSVTASCNLSRTQILSSTTQQRANAISRGFTWLDARVPYSQSRSHGGYRTDCSGFVSMCWQTKQPGFTTADYSTGGAGSAALGSYNDLQPGDAMVRRANGSGHVVLFVGWNDAAKTQACTLEEANTAQDMQFGVRTVASLKSQGFKAIHNTSFTNTTPAAADDDDQAAGDDDDTTASTGSGSVAGTPSDSVRVPAGSASPVTACANDGTCNPGNDGSGLICVSGACVPGCHSTTQCPGSEVCVANQCQ